MAGNTKIMLSQHELQVVNDAEWILTKHRITQKVNLLFNEQVALINNLFLSLPLESSDQLLSVTPKITKGENYKGLPYVMLDYPSLFNKEKIFALRTMFWWGKYFSITLHLGGNYKQKYVTKNFLKAMHVHDDLHICINEDQWHHDFDPTNYVPVKSLSPETINELIANKAFLKIAIKYDFQQWQSIESLLKAGYKKIIILLTN